MFAIAKPLCERDDEEKLRSSHVRESSSFVGRFRSFIGVSVTMGLDGLVTGKCLATCRTSFPLDFNLKLHSKDKIAIYTVLSKWCGPH